MKLGSWAIVAVLLAFLVAAIWFGYEGLTTDQAEKVISKCVLSRHKEISVSQMGIRFVSECNGDFLEIPDRKLDSDGNPQELF